MSEPADCEAQLMSYGLIYFGRFENVDVRRFRKESGESSFESTAEEVAEDQMYDLLRIKGKRVDFGKWICSESMGDMEEGIHTLLTTLASCGGEGRITLLGDPTCPVELARSYGLSKGKLDCAELSQKASKAALAHELYQHIVERVTPGGGDGEDDGERGGAGDGDEDGAEGRADSEAPVIILWGGKKQSFAQRKEFFASLRKGEVAAGLPEVSFERLIAQLLEEYPEAVRRGKSLRLGELGAAPDTLAFEVTWTEQFLTARFEDPEDFFPNCLLIAAAKLKLTGAPLDAEEDEAMA
jgi:hypothetical protein